jgi:hypothetical protein
LYERRWQGQALREDEFVISTDEKTSLDFHGVQIT